VDAAVTGYEAIVAVAVVLHFVFVGYLVCGGFVAWRFPRTIWPHIVTGVWALGITLVPWLECPLTIIERWARGPAGMAPLPESGFIAHYISGVFYPAGAAGTVRLSVAVLVAASWAGYVALHRRRATDDPDRRAPHALPAAPPAMPPSADEHPDRSPAPGTGSSTAQPHAADGGD